MNDEYESPRISAELGNLTPDRASERNPLAHGFAAPVLAEIDGQSVEDLAQEHGTPLFVFSERSIRQKARAMREAFLSRYPDTEFFWSFKTNYLDAVCSILKSEGWGAEIVSSFEFNKALKLGFQGKEILYNGPYKSRKSIKNALKEGALIQIDNWDELERIESVVAEIGGHHDVGIRVWFPTGHSPVWSKFGFALSSGEARRAALRIIESEHLTLHTLHCHIGTYLLDPGAYSVAAQALVALRSEIADATGHLVPCLNLGGGFPSQSLLHGMSVPASDVVPPIEAYAEAISVELNRLPKKERPVLRLESGRHLIDEAGYLIGTVVAIKGGAFRSVAGASSLSSLGIKEQTLRGESPKTSYIVDMGINLLFTAAWFALSVHSSRAVGGLPEQARLVGDLCMEIDVIRENVMLPKLQLGDRVSLWPVGAYNLGQSMQFIHLRPAVVLIDEASEVHVIRRRERLEDVETPEDIPDHLRGPADG